MTQNITSNNYLFRGELIDGMTINYYSNISYSPCDKYIACYKKNSRYVDIYDLYTNKLVYRHQIFHKILKIEWIPSTKENNYCPLRLLFLTDSSFIFLLNIATFKTESFECTKSGQKPTSIAVSNKGNGILVVVANKYLFYVSMKKHYQPKILADLLLNIDKRNNEIKRDQDRSREEKADNDGDDSGKEDDDDAKASELHETTGNVEKESYLVKDIKWSPCNKRIAIIYEKCYESDDGLLLTSGIFGEFVSLLAYEFGSVYRLGFISHPHKTYPLGVDFRNHFKDGALMAICWSNGIISQHHLCFNTSHRY